MYLTENASIQESVLSLGVLFFVQFGKSESRKVSIDKEAIRFAKDCICHRRDFSIGTTLAEAIRFVLYVMPRQMNLR